MFVVFTHAILSSADQVRIVIYRTFEFDIFIKLLIYMLKSGYKS